MPEGWKYHGPSTAVWDGKLESNNLTVKNDLTVGDNFNVQSSAAINHNTAAVTDPSLMIENTSTGDPVIDFKIGTTHGFVGLDNSNSDFLTLRFGGTSLSTTSAVILSTTGVGINANPVTGAMLSVTSTTGGFLPPQMTSTQMQAITTPTIGTMVYNSSSGAWYGFSSGSNWVKLNNSA